jgi:adenylate cyclase
VFKGRFNTLGSIFAALVALALFDYHAGILTGLAHRFDDLIVYLQALRTPADPDIVIVDIDEHSVQRMAQLAAQGAGAEGADRWPWGRAVHGELAAGLAKQHPKAIVFDMLFAERDLTRPASDRLFNEQIAPLQNVYIATALHEGPSEGVLLSEVAKALGMLYGRDAEPGARANLLLPLAVAPENTRMGAINALLDSDQRVRAYHVYLPVGGWKIPSLPVRVAADLGYPVPDQRSIMLRWSTQGHRRLSYSDLYEDFSRERAQRDQNEFRDKIVIIGTAATGMYDLRATPLSETYPGVEILATAIDNLKNRRWLHAAPPVLSLLLALLVMTGVYLAFLKELHTLHIGLGLLTGLALLLALTYLGAAQGVLVSVFTPIVFGVALYFACALQEYLHERRERLRAVDYFSRFVNPHVVKDLLARGGLSKAGETRAITVLFSDIRGFTALSETRTPVEVVSILNRYFGRQVEVIFRHGGCLDKFIGDAIMAFWGAPLDDPDHAQHAVMAALEMTQTLEQFKLELGELGTIFDVGIGIHSGAAVVGLIGSENKREYTAIGDTVNLASRIEGLTKGVARVLVSENTMRACAGAFEFKDRGSYKVKGREQEVRLFEPSGKRHE